MDSDGRIVSREGFGHSMTTELFPSGRHLVASDGRVMTIPSLDIEWDFL